MKIGVLALQGAFAEHIQMLNRLGVEASEIRLPKQLDEIDALIIPGGESTTIGKLAITFGLLEPIRQLGRDGLPIWGTCAGMILMAGGIGLDQPTLGLVDVVVERNAFGRQVDSFEVGLSVPALVDSSGENPPFRAIFIRAPRIRWVAPTVEVLARLGDGTIVAARQENLLVTAFHPELGEDLRFHRYFLEMPSGLRTGIERVRVIAGGATSQV